MPAFRVGKPRFRAQLSATLAQATGTNPVALGTVNFDDVAGWDGVNGYVIDRAGFYTIGGAVSRASLGSSGRIRVGWSKNGSLQVATGPPGSGNATDVGFQDVGELALGDVVRLVTVLTGPSPQNLLATDTYLYVWRCGPVNWT